MRVCLHAGQGAAGVRSLIVLLPGAYMTPADFTAAGFPAVLAQRRLAADLAIVELDLTTITSVDSGPLLASLQAEIVAPARRQGYRAVWLGGISLGGLLSLCHAADASGTIDGLCLLAPYPGSRLTAQAIASAGGLACWRPAAAQLQDPEFRVWRWLQNRPRDLPVFVGYGRADRFASRIGELVACLPLALCHTVAGGHEWTAWRQLWEYFLDHQPLHD